MLFVLSLMTGWVLGAVPGGRLVAIAAKDKVLSRGTGNPGPFLWVQKGFKGFAALCVLLEAGKIVAAMQMAWGLTASREAALMAGVVAVIGHGHSPFLRFVPCRGGVVYIGFALGVDVLAGGFLAALGGALYWFLTRQDFALLAVLMATPPVLFLLGGTNPAMAGMVLFGYGLWHHRRAFLTMMR